MLKSESISVGRSRPARRRIRILSILAVIVGILACFSFRDRLSDCFENYRHWRWNKRRIVYVQAALKGLDLFDQGKTNDCIRLVLSLGFPTAWPKKNIQVLFRSERGRKSLPCILRKSLPWILINDAFSIAIPDIMGNLYWPSTDDESIRCFEAILGQRELINRVAEKAYRTDPDAHPYDIAYRFRDVYFAHMEMSILRHADPGCDIDEFARRISESTDKVLSEEESRHKVDNQ